MIPRYTREKMASIWEPENKFDLWLKIEILVCEALAERGEIPINSLENIKKNARFSVSRINAIEEVVKHDVIAFLTCVGEYIGPDARYLHLGLTSSDILDTCFACQLKQASNILLEDIEHFMDILKNKAQHYKNTIMIGRTHGIHAEPITFGLKMALWHEEMRRNQERLLIAKKNISFGKISGAVGTFAHLSPEVEEYVCSHLELEPDPISTQIIQRDRHAAFFATLAVIASSLEKFSFEIRHLQRTEVLESEEFFSPGQKGSSAMPHKRNPVLSENITGLARLVRSHAIVALENVSLWHERDISHSSAERVIAPDSTILLDFMLNRLAGVIEKLVVYPERMKENLEKSRGLIFSEALLLLLTKKGISREEAYRMVQKNAMEVWNDKNKDFKTTVLHDTAILRYLTVTEIETAFDLYYHLRHLDYIFERVFGK
ncbi:MAG TPA: adenylosuccinate lyase [Thermodesulfobacteriota bacterium]|nr:adenylosuccinate lyase [Thermodesulfobacteriota bacterium]